MKPRSHKLLLMGGVVASCAALGIVLLGLYPKESSSPQNMVDNESKSPLLVQNVSGLLPALSAEELVSQSDLIVVGTVGDRSAPFLVDPVDEKDPRFFRDVYFHVDQVLLGTPDYVDSNGMDIAIRTEGGAGEFIETVNDATPDFRAGDAYLLFLCQLHDGTYFNTEGNHYYVVGVSTGAWKEASGEAQVFDSPCWQPDGSQDISLDAIQNHIATTPVSIGDETDPNRHSGVNAGLETIKDEYEQGIIDREEYQRLMDLAELEATSFARIMTRDEQLAYENEVVERALGEQAGSAS